MATTRGAEFGEKRFCRASDLPILLRRGRLRSGLYNTQSSRCSLIRPQPCGRISVDQARDERNIGKSLKESRTRDRALTIFLVSPTTLDTGAAQWMELAYSDAYNVPTFVILHRLTFNELKSRERGVPPLLLEASAMRQPNGRTSWKASRRIRALVNRRSRSRFMKIFFSYSMSDNRACEK